MNEIVLYGTVGADFWSDAYFTASDVAEMLRGMSGDLTVRLNSPGGLAWDGQAIYSLLRAYPGNVHVIIDGVAMSSASLIAMAGDRITMPLGAIMLIHDPAQLFAEWRGTADDHRQLAEYLDQLGNAYAEVYAARAGISREEAREIMRAETLFTGRQAVAAGFATDTDDELQAAAAAAFDYRIYAHAPAGLREASERLGATPAREAVLAMFAGRPGTNDRRPLMAEDDTPAAGTPSATTDPNVTPSNPAPAPEPSVPAPAPAPTMTQEPQSAAPAPRAPQAPTMSAQDVTRVYDVAEQVGLGNDVVRELVNTPNMTLATAVDRLSERWQQQGVNTVMTGRQTARILRDERDVRRVGMSAALVAQMMRSAPQNDQANAFMNMSVVEMAAHTIDWQGSLRSAGDRIDVMMAATHSTSDFPAIFENALNKVLLERYQASLPTYRAISRQITFNDFRPHPLVRIGDFPALQDIGQGGEIKYGTVGESKEVAILKSYAVAIRITRQMIVNDDLGAIDQLLADYGARVAYHEEEVFYAFLGAAKLGDNTALWHADRNNLASSGSKITVDSISAGRAAIRKQTSIDKKKLNLVPSIILVSPDKETEAEKLVATVLPQEAGNVNPFSGRLTPVTSAQLEGNAWYLFASPAQPGGHCFVHGYLSGAEAPRVRFDEPFGQQGMAMSVEHDFGVGASDYRGTWKNPGA